MTRPARRPLIAFALAVWLAALAPGVAAQQDPDALLARPLATREALEALAQRLRLAQAGGPNGGESLLLTRVRARLAAGDFQPGDRVLLEVQGEPALSDTFAVGPDTALQLPSPAVGSLPLRGVLRVEFPGHVARHVSRFVREPVVRARSLLRVSVQGEVVRAGYHGVPADAVLTEVLTAAGGTTRDADMEELRVERDGEPLLDGRDLQHALSAGRTLDDAGLRDGDQFVVPRRGNGGFLDGLRFVWIVVSITGGVYGLSRAF